MRTFRNKIAGAAFCFGLGLMTPAAFGNTVSVGGSAGHPFELPVSNGTDGAFAPRSTLVLRPRSDGIFQFTTVTIPAHVLVTIDAKGLGGPVSWLASGQVRIDGEVDVLGADFSISSPGQLLINGVVRKDSRDLTINSGGNIAAGRDISIRVPAGNITAGRSGSVPVDRGAINITAGSGVRTPEGGDIVIWGRGAIPPAITGISVPGGLIISGPPQTPVPVPAALPLLISGLVGLAGLLSRRRS